jgi:heme/copper-type cytochrome/quinol oxidase subunit 4
MINIFVPGQTSEKTVYTDEFLSYAIIGFTIGFVASLIISIIPCILAVKSNVDPVVPLIYLTTSSLLILELLKFQYTKDLTSASLLHACSTGSAQLGLIFSLILIAMSTQ